MKTVSLNKFPDHIPELDREIWATFCDRRDGMYEFVTGRVQHQFAGLPASRFLPEQSSKITVCLNGRPLNDVFLWVYTDDVESEI